MPTLKELLEGTAVDGKKARRKLRSDAADPKSPLHGHTHRSGWTFDAKQAQHVRSLLGLNGAAKKSAKKAAKKVSLKKRAKA